MPLSRPLEVSPRSITVVGPAAWLRLVDVFGEVTEAAALFDVVFSDAEVVLGEKAIIRKHVHEAVLCAKLTPISLENYE